jgi:hypothetical protein
VVFGQARFGITSKSRPLGLAALSWMARQALPEQTRWSLQVLVSARAPEVSKLPTTELGWLKPH